MHISVSTKEEVSQYMIVIIKRVIQPFISLVGYIHKLLAPNWASKLPDNAFGISVIPQVLTQVAHNCISNIITTPYFLDLCLYKAFL